jgi:hypothetical protein
MANSNTESFCKPEMYVQNSEVRLQKLKSVTKLIKTILNKFAVSKLKLLFNNPASGYLSVRVNNLSTSKDGG